MQKVVNLVSVLLSREAPVSSSVICSVARGAIPANERSLLLENCGHIDLNIDWSHQVLYQFETIGRKLSCKMTTIAKIPIGPALLNETKFDFQRKIKKCKRGLKYWKISSLTLTKHLCHTSGPEAALMQRKDPLTFC